MFEDNESQARGSVTLKIAKNQYKTKTTDALQKCAFDIDVDKRTIALIALNTYAKVSFLRA